jgi:hypothetical protein
MPSVTPVIDEDGTPVVIVRTIIMAPRMRGDRNGATR